MQQVANHQAAISPEGLPLCLWGTPTEVMRVLQKELRGLPRRGQRGPQEIFVNKSFREAYMKPTVPLKELNSPCLSVP